MIEIQKDEEKEKENEIKLLLNIDKLPDYLIKQIYDYMTGIAKFCCNKKYLLLDRLIKDDYYKDYLFWKFINLTINKLNKKQILNFIKKGSIKNHLNIIDKIWYFSYPSGKYFDKQKLVKYWEDNYFLNEEYVKNIDLKIKNRIIDAIYYYFLQEIYRYEKKIYLTILLNTPVL
jgi:hypothetical protein